jgi:catechol 2,3-dioxygenase-like lactoylglutathione lyase family enzyme
VAICIAPVLFASYEQKRGPVRPLGPSDARYILRGRANPWQPRAPLPTRGPEFPMKRKTTESGVRPQPLIAVRDVRKSSRWYAKLLAAERSSEQWQSDHDHLYDRLLVGPALVLQLHAWDEEDHPNLVNADLAPPGHGTLLWFEVDDFDAAVARARKLRAKIVRKPHVNPAPAHREIWLKDPDGYVVVLASPDGEAG